MSQTTLDKAKTSQVQLNIRELEDGNGDGEQKTRKGFKFWMIFVAICISMFMSALEFVCI